MDILAELFRDWTGILSFAVIAFMIGMGLFYLVYFVTRSHDPGE